MTNYFKLVFIFIGLTSILFAFNISKKYPSYIYVFNEFDVDKSYIYDADFSDFVIKYEKNMKVFYRQSLHRGAQILPTMKGLLIGKGVSDLFIYLSMIESGFSTTAVSSKKAVGLWQFMPATAKDYNLVVCDSYDERCDTSSATSAAIRYLNKLHKQFGKWYLAAMAYNCGEGCVERAIKKAGTNDLSILIDARLKLLPQETRMYIKKILLVAMIGENSILAKNNTDTKNMNSGLVLVDVLGGTDLRDVAKTLKLEYKTLQKLNRKIKNGVLSKEKQKYKIMIPIEKVFAFYLRYELKEEKIIIQPNLISHYVTLGETLKIIAKKYHTSSEEIVNANSLEDSYLEVGQFLVVPVNQKIFEQTIVGTSK